jgi:hypothetical protein
MWPTQLLAAGLGLGLLGLLRRPRPGQGRIVSDILALLWIWVCWAFIWKRYATINWAVSYLLPLFAIEALLFLWIGVARGRWIFRPRRNAAGILGIALFVLALAFYPVLAPLAVGPGFRRRSLDSHPIRP